MPALLVTQPLLADCGDRIRALLATVPGTTIALFEDRMGLPPDANADIELAFLSTDVMGASSNPQVNLRLAAFLQLVAQAPALRWLQLCSAGADRPVLRELAARGVQVCTASGANAVEVAHTALAAMLALARDVPLWVEARGAHRWQPQRDAQAPRDLQGARAVVVGLGPIGREIARLARAFGVHVTGVRRSPDPVPECDAVHATADLAQLLPQADWLFLACPLTDATRGLVDAAMLARLPRHARLINVARGAVVDEAALAAALRSGALAGAYSDVFAVEPLPPGSPLWDAPHFLLSAHSAGSSQGFPGRTVEMFLANLGRWARGAPLAHAIRG